MSPEFTSPSLARASCSCGTGRRVGATDDWRRGAAAAAPPEAARASAVSRRRRRRVEARPVRSSASPVRDTRWPAVRLPIRTPITVLRAGACPLCGCSCKKRVCGSGTTQSWPSDARLLKAKDVIEGAGRRRTAGGSPLPRPRGCAKRALCAGQYAVVEKCIGRRIVRRCPAAAAFSPADPDACRDSVPRGPWPAANWPRMICIPSAAHIRPNCVSGTTPGGESPHRSPART